MVMTSPAIHTILNISNDNNKLFSTDSLIIPDNTIHLQDYRDRGLTHVSIPTSVKSIGSNAFNGNELTSVHIPNSVTTIGKLAFANNELTDITISDSVITIEEGAFYCNSYTSVTIPRRFESMINTIFEKVDKITFTFI